MKRTFATVAALAAVTLVAPSFGTPKVKPSHPPQSESILLLHRKQYIAAAYAPLTVRAAHLAKPPTRWPEPTTVEPVLVEVATSTQTAPSTASQSAPPATGKWDALAQCESGGDWHINTGNGYYGGLQFSLRSWQWVGGEGYPHEASREEQIYRAEKLLALQGWGAWPACSRKLGYR